MLMSGYIILMGGYIILMGGYLEVGTFEKWQISVSIGDFSNNNLLVTTIYYLFGLTINTYKIYTYICMASGIL